MPRPDVTNYPPAAQGYIALVPGDNILTALEDQSAELQHLFTTIPEHKTTFAYAPGKWTVKQLLQHIIDTERIMSFRALCFARGEQQPLPGFEENNYAANATAENRPWEHLIAEFFVVRTATIFLLNSFREEDWQRTGTANGKQASALGLSYIIFGHVCHHIQILKNKYGLLN